MGWIFHTNSFNHQIAPTKSKQTVLAIGNVQSGKTRFMIEETKNALNDDYDFVIMLGGSNNLLLDQSFYRFVTELRKSNIQIYDIKNGPIHRIDANEKMVITTLKHQDSLQKIIKTIKNFPEKKFLIFDDESDFGGINIGKGEPSTIFKLLREIYSELVYGTYVSVTATPYADILSKDGYNFDQLIKLKPGDGYKGVREFNNSSKYELIEDDQEVRAGEDTKFILNLVVDHLQRLVKSDIESSQLLINTDLAQREHEKFSAILEKILIILKGTNYLANHFHGKEYDKVVTLVDEISRNIFVLNQKDSEWNQKKHSIVIGGALVSRGYTFPMLLTTLLLNIPKDKSSCDTLLQRGRWFGYREGIFDFMKIYMPHRAIEAYKEAQILNEIIYDSQTKQQMIDRIQSYDFEYINPTGKVLK